MAEMICNAMTRHGTPLRVEVLPDKSLMISNEHGLAHFQRLPDGQWLVINYDGPSWMPPTANPMNHVILKIKLWLTAP